MARGKTIYISGTGKPKPGQGIKVWGPRRKYSPVRRNYSTTDRANFTARIVKNVTMDPYESSTGVDDAYVYMFINVYQELFNSEYKPLIQKMYEEFMIKKYTCTMSLDGSSSLVTVNMPQSTFYCAQDRNGINAEGGFKKPQDYASVYSKPINYYSPFKTGCGLSVSGIQEASSFISCDMFKPLTGLWGEINPKTNIPDPTSYRYSQNQTYSQYMFKPVILCAVKVPTQPIGTEQRTVQPTFTVELKIDLVGRGIRALKNDVSNLTANNAAKAEDIAAGKIAFDYSGSSMTGTMIPPINTSLAFTRSGTYTVGDSSGGYPISATSLISVRVPSDRPVIDTLQLMDRTVSDVRHVVPISLLPRHDFPSNGAITDIDAGTYVMRAAESEFYVAYFSTFETAENALMLTLVFTRCVPVSDGTYTAYTPFTSDNADTYRLIPSVYFSGFNLGSLSSEHLVVTFGNASAGEYVGYFGCLPAFIIKLTSSSSGNITTYYSGVSLNTEKYDTDSID